MTTKRAAWREHTGAREPKRYECTERLAAFLDMANAILLEAVKEAERVQDGHRRRLIERALDDLEDT